MAGIRKNWRAFGNIKSLAVARGSFNLLGLVEYVSVVSGQEKLNEEEMNHYYEARWNILKWDYTHEKRKLSEEERERAKRKIASAQRMYFETKRS